MNIDTASILLELLADKSRLCIVKALLKQRRLCGNDLLKEVECGQSTLSHHMNTMVEAKLINARKHGNKVIYSLNYDTYFSLLNYLGKETDLPKFTQPIKEKPVIDQVENIIQEQYVNPPEEKKEEKKEAKEDVPVYLL